MAFEFVVTDDHIKLLQHMWVDWDYTEYGAPSIDPKRPYGNSDVPQDIADVLDWNWPDEEEDADYAERVEKLGDAARIIHEEMQTVLQILLVNLSIHPGPYTKSGYSKDWKPA